MWLISVNVCFESVANQANFNKMSQLEIEKICRLCGEKKGRLRSLFEERQEYPLSLRQIIFEVSRLEVDPEDRMPQQACKWCITTLLKMYDTIESYRANDLKLREQLGPIVLVEIKEEEEEMDIEMLEKALTVDLEVGDILLKQEYVDSESHREGEVFDQSDETFVTTPDLPDAEIEEETVGDKEDDEWKPTDQDDKEEDLPKKKPRRRRTKQIDKHEDVSEKKPRRRRRTNQEDGPVDKPKRRRKLDPNCPRLHDHKCYICKSESQGSSEALIGHLNSSHIDLLPYTCPECVMDTVVIKTVQRLNAHKRQHLNPIKCPQCDKRYTDKNSLSLHVKTYHDNPSQPICDHCGEVFATKSSLLYHMRLHTNATTCEFCGKIFRERQKLRLHIQRRHEKLKNHECNICKKKLGSLDSVKTHMKTYHSNQKFKCSYCPKTFTAELTHRCHEKKHIENPDYVPTKDWSEYCTIVEGEENKRGTKLKKCNLCGFVTLAMGSHISTEHFQTEHRCEICNATFKRKQSLKQHLERHQGKGYQCPICNREVTDRKNLIAHLRTKQHRDHPLAQSLEWLGFDSVKSRARKRAQEFKKANVDTQQQDDIEIEVGMDDSLSTTIANSFDKM